MPTPHMESLNTHMLRLLPTYDFSILHIILCTLFSLFQGV